MKAKAFVNKRKRGGEPQDFKVVDEDKERKSF